MRIFSYSVTWLPALLVALSLSGCSQQETAPPASSEPPRAPAPLTDEARAQLANADAADGKTDQVVSKCVTCRLQMNGKAAQAATIDGYTVHLCSAVCKKMFEKDPATALLALKASEK